MATEITVGGTQITFSDWSISVPTSPVDVAPRASITTNTSEPINANDPVTITIDGTVRFEGRTRSGGRKGSSGGVSLDVAHPARDLFEDTVDISLSSPTTEQVLQAALNDADAGGQFTLNYAGSAVSLANDYNEEDRSVKRVFRDMMDRTSRVWWLDPAGTTINVEPVGAQGLWQEVDTTSDGARLEEFDAGNVDTVRNAVTVVGTGDTEVRESVTDATSVSTFGRRTGNSPYNVSYITSASEAQAVADELLVPEPLPEGKLLVGANVGDVVQPLANYEVDVRDAAKNVDADNLVIEQQTIEQGRATLQVGAGSGVSIEELNRKTKSREDTTDPGSVYGGERIADDSIDTPKLVDAAVIEQKLQDAAVATGKLQNNAVVNGKLDDLSVSETKIQDGSIATPKLQAEAVTANEILADTITASEIAAGTITATEILADTITASEIAAGTITALEIAADTITAAHCRACDDDGTEQGVRINDLTRHLWDVCTAQQDRLEAAEERIDTLEQRLSDLEAQIQ